MVIIGIICELRVCDFSDLNFAGPLLVIIMILSRNYAILADQRSESNIFDSVEKHRLQTITLEWTIFDRWQ